MKGRENVTSPMSIRWTRDDCVLLERAGILPERYELVEGVINTMGQNVRHANVVRMLLVWLFAIFGNEVVLTQTSIDVRPEDNPTSEPQPDIVVLDRPAYLFHQNPASSDIRLLIEVSDTTLAYDLNTKASLYSRASILEYWVVSLTERRIYIHREPVNGNYDNVTVYGEEAEISPLSAPLGATTVGSLLPPA